MIKTLNLPNLGEFNLKVRTPFNCSSGKHFWYEYWEPHPHYGPIEIKYFDGPYMGKCSCPGLGCIAGPHEICVGKDREGNDIYTGSIIEGPTHSQVHVHSSKSNKTRNILWAIRKFNNPLDFMAVPLDPRQKLRTTAPFDQSIVVGHIYNIRLHKIENNEFGSSCR